MPEAAEIVRSCFRWYADGEAATNTIARRLNNMGLTTSRGGRWTPSSVRDMLTNPVYIGKIRWNTRVTRVRIEDGERIRSRPLSDDPILVDGLHEGIVPPELFERVQAIFRSHGKRPVPRDSVLVNPLAGLVYCAHCGCSMLEKHTPNRRGDFLCCQTQDCPTCSAYIDVVESAILEALGGWLSEFDGPAPEPPREDPEAAARAAARAALAERLRGLEAQSGRLYDLLEQGVYSVAVYTQRRADLDARLAEARAALEALDARPRPDPRRLLVPQLRTVLDGYRAAPTAADKNALLRTVLDRVTYDKTQRNYRNTDPSAHLHLTLHPKTPEDLPE